MSSTDLCYAKECSPVSCDHSGTYGAVDNLVSLYKNLANLKTKTTQELQRGAVVNTHLFSVNNFIFSSFWRPSFGDARERTNRRTLTDWLFRKQCTLNVAELSRPHLKGFILVAVRFWTTMRVLSFWVLFFCCFFCEGLKRRRDARRRIKST